MWASWSNWKKNLRLPNTTFLETDWNLSLKGLYRGHSNPKCASFSATSWKQNYMLFLKMGIISHRPILWQVYDSKPFQLARSLKIWVWCFCYRSLVNYQLNGMINLKPTSLGGNPWISDWISQFHQNLEELIMFKSFHISFVLHLLFHPMNLHNIYLSIFFMGLYTRKGKIK